MNNTIKKIYNIIKDMLTLVFKSFFKNIVRDSILSIIIIALKMYLFPNFLKDFSFFFFLILYYITRLISRVLKILYGYIVKTYNSIINNNNNNKNKPHRIEIEYYIIKFKDQTDNLHLINDLALKKKFLDKQQEIKNLSFQI